MFQVEDVLHCADGEEVKFLVRRHPIALMPGLGIAALLIVVPFFFLFPLFNSGAIGTAAFIVSVLAGAVLAVRSFILWDSNVLIVTTMRLVRVDQRSVFSRFVTDVPIPSVTDMSWHRHGIVDAFCSCGTLVVKRGGERIEITRMPRPERIVSLIGEAAGSTLQEAGDEEERIHKLQEELEKLPPETIAKVEQIVHQEIAHEPSPGLVLQKKNIA